MKITDQQSKFFRKYNVYDRRVQFTHNLIMLSVRYTKPTSILLLIDSILFIRHVLFVSQ
jgi:hypothetical protein